MTMSNIEFYRSLLHVNKHALDEALEVQAQYQEEIAREVARLGRAAAEAKDKADRLEHSLALEAKQDSPKLAAEAAKGEARANQHWQNARSNQQARQQELEEWQGLYEAWKQRGFSIKGLAGLYTDQYFAVTSVTGGDSAAVARQRLAEARRPLSTPSNKEQPDSTIVRRRTSNVRS